MPFFARFLDVFLKHEKNRTQAELCWASWLPSEIKIPMVQSFVSKRRIWTKGCDFKGGFFSCLDQLVFFVLFALIWCAFFCAFPVCCKVMQFCLLHVCVCGCWLYCVCVCILVFMVVDFSENLSLCVSLPRIHTMYPIDWYQFNLSFLIIN